MIQPWAGGIFVTGNAYIQGFTALVISTESVDPTLYTADLGVGYRIYQGNIDDVITSLTPTIEGHLTTSLDNTNRNSDIYFPDLFVLTGGVHIGLCNKAYLTIGAGLPVAGPRQYDYEILCQLNYRF